MNLMELLGNVGMFGLAVMITLAALSIYSVGVILQKQLRFRAGARRTETFKPVFGKLLRAGKLGAAAEAAREHHESYVAQVVVAGITEYGRAKETGTDPAASLELVTNTLEDTKVHELIEMKRGLGTLATIGSTAPFIGLFGTVVGIINAFQGIAATGSGGMGAVTGGIAEALVSTALGIFVAIPAVVAFNHFMGMLERFHLEMNRASSELTTFLFKVPGADHEVVPPSKPANYMIDLPETAHASR
jgi:biopolymer transport protein ExbB/biopolymer transport protein TolQ